MKKNGVIGSGQFLSLVVRDGWEYIERTNCSGVVLVLSKTADDKAVLIEQFRPPVKSNVIGFPAGLSEIGPDGEKEPLDVTAKRELLEETGFEAGKIEELFIGPVSAGLCKDMVTIFMAFDLEKVGEGGGVDHDEDIIVHEVPLETVDEWLEQKRKQGVLVSPGVYLGLYFLKGLSNGPF